MLKFSFDRNVYCVERRLDKFLCLSILTPDPRFLSSHLASPGLAWPRLALPRLAPPRLASRTRLRTRILISSEQLICECRISLTFKRIILKGKNIQCINTRRIYFLPRKLPSYVPSIETARTIFVALSLARLSNSIRDVTTRK